MSKARDLMNKIGGGSFAPKPATDKKPAMGGTPAAGHSVKTDKRDVLGKGPKGQRPSTSGPGTMPTSVRPKV